MTKEATNKEAGWGFVPIYLLNKLRQRRNRGYGSGPGFKGKGLAQLAERPEKPAPKKPAKPAKKPPESLADADQISKPMTKIQHQENIHMTFEKLKRSLHADKTASEGGYAKAVEILDGLRKQAAPYGGKQLQHQMYAPLMERRELSPEEEAMVAEEEGKWIPKIFKSDADSPAVASSNPKVTAALAGLLGGGAGATVGGLVGADMAQGTDLGEAGGGALGALVGGLPLGALTALIAYKLKDRGNKDRREMLRRLPEGATRRDMKADPVYQADASRRALAAAAAYGGGGMGLARFL